MELTTDQKCMLDRIRAAGTAGLVGVTRVSAASLVRKGLVKMEVVEKNVRADKLFNAADGRSLVYTIQGRFRFYTVVRYTIAS
jgi:hypothetical protein